MKVVGNDQFAKVSDVSAVLKSYPECRRTTVFFRHTDPVAALVSIERYNDMLALEKLFRHPGLIDRFREQAEKAHRTPLEVLRSLDDLGSPAMPLHDTESGSAIAEGG
ncbi:MAG: hypothetical protein ACE5GX_19250 [Thermoanaerobaculia bacterium]